METAQLGPLGEGAGRPRPRGGRSRRADATLRARGRIGHGCQQVVRSCAEAHTPRGRPRDGLGLPREGSREGGPTDEQKKIRACATPPGGRASWLRRFNLPRVPPVVGGAHRAAGQGLRAVRTSPTLAGTGRRCGPSRRCASTAPRAARCRVPARRSGRGGAAGGDRLRVRRSPARPSSRLAIVGRRGHAPRRPSRSGVDARRFRRAVRAGCARIVSPAKKSAQVGRRISRCLGCHARRPTPATPSRVAGVLLFWGGVGRGASQGYTRASVAEGARGSGARPPSLAPRRASR